MSYSNFTSDSDIIKLGKVYDKTVIIVEAIEGQRQCKVALQAGNEAASNK